MARLEDLTILLNMKDKTGAAFGSVNKKLKKLNSAVKVSAKLFAAMGGAVLSIVGTFKLFQGGLDNLAKTSDKLGVPTEQLMAIRQAAEFAGIATNQLDTAMQRMLRRVSEVAATGKGTAAGALAQLGLDAKELNNLRPDEILSRILNELEGIGNSGDKIGLAFKFFDAEGVNLVRLTSQSIKSARDEMDELGLSVSRLDAAKVEHANDQLVRMRNIIDGYKQKIAANLADPISGVIDLIIDLRKENALTDEEIILKSQGYKRVAQGLVIVFATVNNTIKTVQLAITKLFSNLGVLAKGFIDTLANLQDKIPFFDGYDFSGAQNSLEFFVEGSINQLKGLEEGIIPIFGDGGVLDKLDQKLDSIAEKRRNALSDSVDSVTAPPPGTTPETGGDTIENGLIDAQFSEMMEATQAMQQMRDSITAGIIENAKLVGEALAKAQTEAQERALKIQGALLGVGNAFGKMADLAANKSEKSFKVFKRIQIALATVAAYSAAVQSLGEAKGDPFLRIAAYAQILSVGLGAIAQMRSVNVGGGGGSAGASAGAGATSPQNTARGGTAPTESRSAGRTIVQLEGRDRTYDQTDIENIVDALKQSGADIEVLYNS